MTRREAPDAFLLGRLGRTQDATFEKIDGAGHLPWLDDPA